MTTPTSSELTLLNTHPQRTDLYLSIYEPELALICQTTGTYDQATQKIDFYNIVSGSTSDVQTRHFQVALVGSAPNLDDYGRTWVRLIDDKLRFVESDHINWQPDLWVTVLKYTEIIPVFPRIIQNPSDEEDVIFYKIWDIAYTNQNSILGSFINMGSNYAGFLENGTGTVYWSASGTSNLLGDGLTYAWTFEGATITGSNAHTPGYVAYNQAGHHRTLLRVTSASGRVDTSIRYVSMYDRPGAGDNTPILNWEFSESPNGSRESIGWSCRIRVRDTIPESKIRDGMLVVIFGEDWYGSTKQSVNNNNKGREGIKFVGYINAGTIQYNYADGWVEFEVISPTKFMELCECFSCSVESKTSPSKWYELLNMDIRRAVYHYLAWQSSVLLCCDVEFKNFIDRYIQYFDADRTSLYDAVNSVISSARGGRTVSDRLGKIWIEQEPDVLLSGTSTLPIALSIAKKDWIGEPTIDERQFNEVSFIELGGISYEPTSNTFSALLSDAPGTSPGYRGKVERAQGWALSDQDELNQLSGNKYAYMNSRYPNIEFNLRGNFANLDIAPQEQIQVSIASGDTPRNVVFSSKAFVPRNMTLQWDARTKVTTTKISVAEITQGFPGDTVVIPDVPPDDTTTGGGGTYNQPPITVPPIDVTPTPTGLMLYDEGTYLGLISALNFVGDNVTAKIAGVTGTATITGIGNITLSGFFRVAASDDFPAAGVGSEYFNISNADYDPDGMWNSGDDYVEVKTAGNYVIIAIARFIASYSGADSDYEGIVKDSLFVSAGGVPKGNTASGYARFGIGITGGWTAAQTLIAIGYAPNLNVSDQITANVTQTTDGDIPALNNWGSYSGTLIVLKIG